MSKDLIPQEIIENKIYLIRGQKVMLDHDLAALYQVRTMVLNQAVKRNIERFPEDFMFQLTQGEFDNLISQFVISSWGGTRKLPYVFTEQGIAMLSGVLKSKIAVQVNIQIIRTFVKLRKILFSHNELRRKLKNIPCLPAGREKKYDGQFKVVFDVIKKLMGDPVKKPSKNIGFLK